MALQSTRDVLLDLLFPSRCVHCSADLPTSGRGTMLCAVCRALLAPPRGAVCLRCGASLPEGVGSRRRCRRCKHRRLAFCSVIHLGKYDQRLRLAVLHTKNAHRESLAAVLAELLGEQREEELRAFDPEVVVPVPMFWGRRLLRGGNSPEVIAARLGDRLGIPVCRMLSRRRNTLPQGGLAPAARFENVRNAFALRGGFDCSGARVLLVDDILTTGATCHEAAKVLLRHAAAKVAVAVLARAQGPD